MGINNSLIEELGYENKDELPNTIFEVNPTMSLLRWRKLWKKMRLEGKISLESEYITMDESIYPVQLSAVLVKVEQEEFAMLVSENLMEINRFQELLEFTSRIASIGSWEWDLVKNELIFNKEMYHLLNLPPHSKINQLTLQDFVTEGLSEEDLQVYTQKIEAAVTEGTAFEFEFSFESKGVFKNFMLHAHPVVFEDEPIKVYGTLQNVDKISKRTDTMYFTQYCLDYAKDMIFWLTEGSFIEYVNFSTCKKLGYTRDELIGQHISFIDKDHQHTSKDFWESLKEQESLEFETFNQTKSGVKIPVRVTTNYINYRGKELNCAFVRDLSKVKKRNEILNMSKITLDNSPEIIFWANEDGELEYFNQAFMDRLGYSKKEIKSRNVLDFIHNGDKRKYAKGWKRLKKDKFYANVSRSLITKNGDIFPAEMTISMIEVEGKYFSTTICRDITERNRLAQLATMSKHSLDRSLDMIFWLNEDGSFKYFNEAFLKKTGYSEAEVQKMTILDFFPLYKTEEFQKGWEQLKEGTVLIGRDRTLKLKNGQIIPCEVNVSMVQLGDNEFSVTVLRDVTDRKEKESKLDAQFNEINRLQEATAAENIELREEIDLEFNFSNIITREPIYKRVLRQVEQVADTDATVLILGETGTGKELLARAIHQLSEREELPMVKVNCGALPENLIESELFGHEKGSFTGAYQQKIGKFERADKGTIFLDEIGELPLDLQAKLLRVLQEGEIERVGGNKMLNINVRIIAATNRKLEEEVAKGTFREDLYYRLNVFPIFNIPLRERREDIPVLIKHFATKYAKKINKEISEISPSSMNKLMAYDFLGNVRELENLVERAVILAKGKVLTFDLSLTQKTVPSSSKFLSMEEMQQQHIIDALKRTKGKVSGDLGAAELLGMNDKTLTSRMKKLGIDKRDYLKN